MFDEQDKSSTATQTCFAFGSGVEWYKGGSRAISANCAVSLASKPVCLNPLSRNKKVMILQHVPETEEKHISPKTQNSASANAKKPRFEADKHGNEEGKMNTWACSREAKMINMVVGKDPCATLQQEPRRKFIAKQTTVTLNLRPKNLTVSILNTHQKIPLVVEALGNVFMVVIEVLKQ